MVEMAKTAFSLYFSGLAPGSITGAAPWLPPHIDDGLNINT